ncbi:head maturation protease, ClpP-related [Paracoccus alkenifer]|uniref:ATP-dependent protease ClpP, protease subunit n=1 Tax=Paracoccus alkenifer TaxID=65735 RepID=A0A1H6NB17_9RHOB|nr:head maturation protease, ClpP-related [Paracoccus alkenifer]SEI10057.1 ATP-dependent protease ClpP, protease subunit [Paracoccus alkenifer]
MNEILLYGTVGSSFWDEEYFTARQVREALAGISGPVTVRINSGGGIATEGQAIYTALRAHAGPVSIVIEGIAASAASLVAMAGDSITMSLGSVMMIHDPAMMWTDGRGTEDDHLHAAKGLGVLANAYAGIYAKRAGISIDAARAIMKDETYFDGHAALEAGFATAVDDDGDEIDPVAFDYRLYRRAPERLRAASAGLTRARSRSQVLAMMARPLNISGRKGHTMPKSQVTAATAADEEDVDALEEEDPEMRAEDGQDDPDARAEDDQEIEASDDDEDDEPSASASQIVAVVNMCAMHGAPDRAADFVNRGLTPKQAYAELTSKGGKKVKIDGRGPSARIMRDERDTRRAGIEGAIIARMNRDREVGGPARDYMSMTLAEMAMAGMGRRERVARGGGEQRAIEMAFSSHTTSDFPAVFENALNKRLANAYAAAQPVYRAIAERIDFTDFRPHPIAQVGDWPTLLPVEESGEIKYGTVSDKKESVALVAYARAFRITRQMMVNDDLGAIDRIINTRGRAIAAFEDATFFSMMLSGSNSDGPTLQETTRQVFNATDGTKAGTASAVNPAGIAKGYEAMRNRKGVSGESFLAVEPRILLTGPAKEFEAMQLLAPIQAAQASNVNPYVGKLTPATTPYVAGNAWYMFADPAEVPVFMYGYLQGEEGPRLRTDEPFGQQGVAYSVELDFGCGATDFRGGYKNAGA